MKTILVSGFGTFGNYQANSSEMIANIVNQTVVEGFQVESFLFPGKISPIVDRGLTLLDRASKLKHSGVISLGMDSSAKGLKVESMATNLIFHERYCDPRLNNKPVSDKFALGETLPMDLGKWDLGQFYGKCREKGIPTEPLSQSANTFCCNQLMFQVRALQLSDPKYKDIPFIFVHIPCSPLSISLTKLDEFKAMGKTLLISTEILIGLRILLRQLVT